MRVPPALPGWQQKFIDRLYAETAKFLQQPDVKEIWASQGAELGGQPPEQFAAFIKTEIAKWGKVARDNNVSLD